MKQLITFRYEHNNTILNFHYHPLCTGQRPNHRSGRQKSGRCNASIRRVRPAQHVRPGALPNRARTRPGKLRGCPADTPKSAGGPRKGGTRQAPARGLPAAGQREPRQQRQQHGNLRGLDATGFGQLERVGGSRQPDWNYGRVAVRDGGGAVQRCGIAAADSSGGNLDLFIIFFLGATFILSRARG